MVAKFVEFSNARCFLHTWEGDMDKIDEIEHKRIRIGDALLPIGESYMKSFFGKI